MSSLLVKVICVGDVKPHPDPETTALELAEVMGWQIVVRKDSMKAGDMCVYFPLDSLIPEEVSDAIGVTKYLSKGRVRAAKLRGTPSYGLLWPVQDFTKYIYDRDHQTPFWTAKLFEEGDDVAELLGVTKWEPPLEFSDADTEVPHPAFLTYTEIENLRSYPDVLEEGEEVVIREKTHGTNARMALIEDTFMAGSHNRRLKFREDNRHWFCFSGEIKEMLYYISQFSGGPVVAYAEIYGSGVQDLHYGLVKGNVAARVYDISVHGRYLDEKDFVDICNEYTIPVMPLLYQGPWSMDVLEQFRDSDSVIEGADCMMEGVVIKPTHERTNPFVGRVILKYLWDRYLTRKGGTEKK